MPASATIHYAGDGLIPCWAPQEAITDAVRLIPGTYVAGTILGEITTLTGNNDVQTLTVTGTPTGGTIQVAFNGDIATLNYNSTVAQTQAAIQAMPSIAAAGGSAVVTVSGSGALPGNTAVVTFSGALGNRQMPVFTVNVNALTGGSSPAASWAHTTVGTAVGATFAAYNSGNSDGTQVAKCILKFATVVDILGHHNATGQEWGVASQQLSGPAFVKGYFKTSELTGIDSTSVGNLGRMVRGSTSALTDATAVLAMF